VSGGIVVRPVSREDGFAPFLRAAEAAQGHDPRWVPTLDADLTLQFDPRANPFLRANPVQAFVALREGSPVGRIVAIEHRAHLARHRDGAAHFGFLEGIDDRAVFAALIDAAASWAAARGLGTLAGPYSFSINHEVGLLVEGFDTAPVIRTPHHQPWYARHLQALGFQPVQELIEERLRLPETESVARTHAALARWPQRHRFAIVPIGRWGYAAGVRAIQAVFNDAWAENWGFVPVEGEEAAFIARLMRPVARSGWLALATWDGAPIGALAHVPDVNPWLKEAGPRPSLVGWARLAAHILAGRPHRTRIAMLGVARAFKGTRPGAFAAAQLGAYAFELAARAGASEIAFGWMLAENRSVLNLCAVTPARLVRRWNVFAMPITVPSSNPRANRGYSQ
jgi:hypothetical protein